MITSKFIPYFILLALQTDLTLPNGTWESVPDHTEDTFTGEDKGNVPDNSSSDPSEFQFLITGGYRPTTNDLAKYVVSLRLVKRYKFFGSDHACGGAIISKKIILTAAHCLFLGHVKLQPKDMVVVAGTPKRLKRTSTTQVMKVKQITSHSQYSDFGYDIGMVVLQEALHLGESVATLKLTREAAHPGTECTALGWGAIIPHGPLPNEIVNVDLVIQPRHECYAYGHTFRKSMLCVSNPKMDDADSCEGDSGGPLICNERLYGLVSFGRGCGEPHYPGIYTDVFMFVKWIRKNWSTPNTVPIPVLILGLALLLVIVNLCMVTLL